MEYEDDEMSALFIEHLIEIGCMEVVGIDQSGEFIISVTPKMAEHFPEIWDEVVQMTNQAVYNLWSKGLVEIAFMQNGTPYVMPNENTEKYQSYDLEEEEIMTVETIIRKMREDRDEIPNN
jgi:hypothetical protein